MTNKQEFFSIASLSRADIESIFGKRVADLLSDSDMDYLAEQLKDDYLNQMYWQSLEIICQDRFPEHIKSRERFIYGMSRPAMYATCPDEGHDFEWSAEPSMTEYPYFAAYFRALTEEEQYRYEMRPYSANAYKFQIDELVLTENGHVGKIIKHGRNWLYTVEVTVIGKGSFVDTYREKELQRAPDVINPIPPRKSDG